MKRRAKATVATLLLSGVTVGGLATAAPALAMRPVSPGTGAWGGGGGGGGVAKAPYRFEALSLFCAQTEDSGEDEAYLTVSTRGVVWGPHDMNEGGPDSLVPLIDYRLRNLTFSDNATVRLYDEDTGFFDDDDLLGTLTVTAAMADGTERAAQFTEDGANYTMIYRVSKR